MRRRPLALAVLGSSLVLAPLLFAGPASASTAQAATSRVIISPEPGRVVRSHLVRVRVSASGHPNAISARLNGVQVGDQFGARRRGARSMTASVSDGLRRGPNVLRVTTRRRDGAKRTATVRFTVRTRRPLVGAGQNRRIAVGATLSLAGVVRTGALGGRGRGTGWKIRSAPRRSGARADSTPLGNLARPVAITGPEPRPARLTGPAGLTAGFTPTTPGRYQLAFRTGSGNTATTDVVTLTAVPKQILVPIDTQVGPPNQTAVRIGETTYPAEVPDAYRGTVAVVIVLTRNTLAVVSHKTYTLDQWGLISRDLKQASSDDLVVVAQGPGNGVVQPTGSAPFASIGTTGSDAIRDRFAAIGVPGLGRGQATQTDDDETVPGHGLKGYLTPDTNQNYRFVPSERHPIHLAATPQEPCQQCDPKNGFLVRVYDPVTMAPAGFGTRFFNTDGRDLTAGQQTDEAVSMADALNGVAADRVVTVESVTNQQVGESGTRPPVGAISASAMGRLADAIVAVGGTRDAFNQVAIQTGAPAAGGQVYALVGWKGAGEWNGAEAASGIHGAPVAPALSTVLRPDRQTQYLRPSPENEGGENAEALTDIVMEPPSTDWPCNGNADTVVPCSKAPGVAAAISYIGSKVTQLGSDPRAAYALHRDLTGIDKLVANVKNPGTFGADDWNTAQEELAKELAWVTVTRHYLDDVAEPFTDSALPNAIKVHTIADDIFKATRPSPDEETAFHWLDLTKIVLELADHITAGVTGAITQLIDLGQWIAGATANGAPTYEDVNIEADSLADEVTQRATDIGHEFKNLADIVVSDPVKLAYFGTNGGCTPGDGCPPALAWDTDKQAEVAATFTRGIKSLAYQTFVPLGYDVYKLTQQDVLGNARPYRSRPPSAQTAYLCNESWFPWRDVPAAATTAVVDAADPAGGGWSFQQYVLAEPPARASTQHATPPPDDLLTRMFKPVPANFDANDPGLGISPQQFMARATPSYWEGSASKELRCRWG